MKSNKITFVGKGTDSKTQEEKLVMSGEHVFFLMDSRGLPFQLIIDLLSENNSSYDVKGFIQAAYNSKNHNKEKMRILFENNKPRGYPEFMEKINYLLNEIYDNENNNNSN